MELSLIKKHSLESYVSNLPTERAVSRGNGKCEIVEITPHLGIEKSAIEKVIEISRDDTLLELILNYPIVNPSFLNIPHPFKYSICHKDDFFELTIPRFAVYSLDSPQCCIDIHFDRLNYAQNYFLEGGLFIQNPSKLPKTISRELLGSISVTKSFHRYMNEIYSCKLTSDFIGFLPEDVKKSLSNLERFFGKKIYVIAEAEWDKNITVVKHNLHNRDGVSYWMYNDPLLIGVNNDLCFLLAEFNVSPLEHYIASELTTFEGDK